MKSIISIISITLMFPVNAQDLKTEGLNSINIKNWMNTPHVNGRFATSEDVKENRAIYRSDSIKGKYIPIDLEIPFLALVTDPITEIKDTVVVIQAHKFNGGIQTGYKSFHGTFYGTSLLKKLIIIDEITDVGKKLKTIPKLLQNKNETSNNIDYKNNISQDKINIIIPNCGIGSEWNRLKYSLNDKYWAIYEQINDNNRGKFLIKKYDSNRPTIPDFLVRGLYLKDSLFTQGKWIGKMLYLGESIHYLAYNKEDEKNSKNYSIYAKGKLIEKEKNEFPYFTKIENYELIVDSHKDKVQQTIRKMDIFSFPSGGFEGGIYIYWIGDLNGDNLLDMLVGISQHYAGSSLSLFLSDSNSKQLFREYTVGNCAYD